MGHLAIAPDLTDELMDSEVPPTSSPDTDLPLWFSALLARTPEAKAHQKQARAPSPLPWRTIVARWPIDRRQRWGDRSNQLQDQGLDWKDAERAAFHELKRGRVRSDGEG